MKLKLANAGSRLIESLLVGRAQARQEVLLGRVSSPSTTLEDDDELVELEELDELEAEDELLEEAEDDAALLLSL